ncbi:hypothetical protein NKH36_20315 [Mesorhizobium sp. M1312]|uniref:hypothetical protein n=1 Tax=unclassified Mesorhizobium TaxID=325217 RepID=UPI00333B851B
MVEDSTAGLDDQEECSLFVLMAHDPIDTLGKATRHNMLVKAECSCGNVRYCRSADLMMVYGGGRSAEAEIRLQPLQANGEDHIAQFIPSTCPSA